jgi:heat shock protein HtpX
MSPGVRASVALGLMVGFYLLAIGVGVGLLVLAWFAVSTEQVATVKLAFFSAVAGGTVLWSLRPRIDRFEVPGPALTREAQPELFGVIEDVARAANQEMPVDVYAIADVNAGVSTRGGVFGIGGRRTMVVGIPLLHLLTVDQFKAVVAHEFGHYDGGDTKIGRLVYHTRAGLARTLAAVHGKLVSVVFNAYGTLLLRVSSAVARHAEFEADAFAARVTSGEDLKTSLLKLDREGAMFPLFYASNMRQLIEEGYWAPVGYGFATFCARPALSRVTVRPADETGAPSAESQYDSHPPTSARVAALDALSPTSPRVADARIAGSLLRDSRQLEADLFIPPDRRAAKLTPVEWADVTTQVFVPRWRRVAREQAQLLEHVRIESPPTSPKDVIQLGRTHGGPRMRTGFQENVLTDALFAIACGVMTRLIDAGWTPTASPSLFSELVRGEERIEPMQAIFEIAAGATPVVEWAKFCEREGLSGSVSERQDK